MLTIRGPCLRPSTSCTSVRKQKHSVARNYTGSKLSLLLFLKLSTENISFISLSAQQVNHQSDEPSASSPATHRFFIWNQLILGAAQPFTWHQNCKLSPFFTHQYQNQNASLSGKTDRTSTVGSFFFFFGGGPQALSIDLNIYMCNSM